jgi:hypothetical protein
MSKININSAIEFIGEFFSELPPQAIAMIICISTLGLYIMCGVILAAILGFLALSITKNGIIILTLCAILVTVFSIYGLIKAIQSYKNIIQRYKIYKS